MKCDVKDCSRSAHAGTACCREHLRWVIELRRAEHEQQIAQLRERMQHHEREMRALEAVYREKMRVD